MKQRIEELKIEDLVLWTENPRDPIDENASDQEIVEKALEDKLSKWTLSKLAKEMGDYYDLSEIPTVVYHGTKPVVYDGNRRIILGKIKLGLVTVPNERNIKIPDFPSVIPCNVCQKKIGLNNVFRKHAESGSWDPLERDIFLYKFMGKEKSAFLILDEDTGIISENSHLNQRFVKDEIFNDENLNKMGFEITGGRLKSFHSSSEVQQILTDISEKVRKKIISTRKQRGKIIQVLDPSTQELIDYNKSHVAKSKNISLDRVSETKDEDQKPTKRTPRKKQELFGGKLFLKMSNTSNLYKDIIDLFEFYVLNKKKLSETFIALIRMSLRLLCETAAQEDEKLLDKYIASYFLQAKKTLDQDTKTTLSNQNVTELTIIQLLNSGAHSYKNSQNLEQTIAMSIIIGAILTISHGKR